MTPPPPINRGLTTYPVADVLAAAAAAISIYRAAVLFFDGYPQSGCLHGITYSYVTTTVSNLHCLLTRFGAEIVCDVVIPNTNDMYKQCVVYNI